MNGHIIISNKNFSLGKKSPQLDFYKINIAMAALNLVLKKSLHGKIKEICFFGIQNVLVAFDGNKAVAPLICFVQLE